LIAVMTSLFLAPDSRRLLQQCRKPISDILKRRKRRPRQSDRGKL
jgi:hypothetical protein